MNPFPLVLGRRVYSCPRGSRPWPKISRWITNMFPSPNSNGLWKPLTNAWRMLFLILYRISLPPNESSTPLPVFFLFCFVFFSAYVLIFSFLFHYLFFVHFCVPSPFSSLFYFLEIFVVFAWEEQAHIFGNSHSSCRRWQSWVNFRTGSSVKLRI